MGDAKIVQTILAISLYVIIIKLEREYNMQLENIYIRDPFILCYNGMYYMYGKETLHQQGFVVYKSNDLKEWSEPKVVFIPDEDFWADRDFWAPEVHFYNGRFYMIASFKAENKRRGSQILVADTPDGNFVPVSEKPATPSEWEALDGTLYTDRFGKPHMVFCHEWLQCGNGSVCEVPLSDELSCVLGEPKVLWRAGDSMAAVNMWESQESLITDGPYMHRLNNGELICTWSTFTEYGYSVLIARSDNGDIDGNWTIDREPLLKVDGGHGMIFDALDGRTMFVMHSPNVADLERAKLYEVFEKKNTIELKEV